MRRNHSVSLLVLAFMGACSAVESPTSSSSDAPGAEPAPRSGQPAIWTSEPSCGDDTCTISLMLRTADSRSGPRVADARLRLQGARLLAGKAGEASFRAGKNVVVRELPGDPTTVRVTIFATDNTDRLSSGELALLTLHREDEGAARVEILTDEPIMAPAEAAEGLIVGDPITL